MRQGSRTRYHTVKPAVSQWHEMNDVVMYGEAKPFDIRKEIKHTVVDQLKIIKQIARMPEMT